MNYSKFQTLVQILCPKVVKRLLMLYTTSAVQQAARVASKMPLSIPIPSARPCIAARH